MPFLTQGKTNWKFVAIVVILAAIVGGGFLFWIRTQEVPSFEFPEIKKPEKKPIEITEEDCEQLSGVERKKCYIALIKEKKDPDLCKKIEEDWKVKYWKTEKFFSECYWAVQSLKIREEKGSIPSDIAKSDRKLKKYLVENLTEVDPYYDIIDCTYIIRGNFDEDQNEEIVTAIIVRTVDSVGMVDSLVMIKEKEDGFYITALETMPWKTRIKKLESLQIIKDQPEFIIFEPESHSGTGLWDASLEILTIEKSEGLLENEFKLIWTGISYSTSMPGDNTVINTEFRDLDGDGNLEIIREGYTCSKIWNEEKGGWEEIGKERIYQVLKWDEEKQSFVEEPTE